VPIIHEPEFLAWEQTVPPSVTGDSVWRFHTYRVALYLVDLAERDSAHIRRAHPSSALSDQLVRAVTSISAHIAEGLGRPTSADRSRCIGDALGSLRESTSWYRSARSRLPIGTAYVRFEQLAELRRLLLGAQRWLSRRPAKSRLV
jgi:four helix bundle protein